jgi:hypothetical protein
MEYYKFKTTFAAHRQASASENYVLAERAILRKEFGPKPSYNAKALARLEERLGLTSLEIADKAATDVDFLKTAAMCIATNSSRQGTKLESELIEGISKSVSRFGVDMGNLSVNELIPVKGSSTTMSRRDAKKAFGKDYKNKILKSFDFHGRIRDHSRYRQILGFAKVCVGNGGHQDNVRVESQEFISWANEHGEADTIYVVLYDTDDKEKDFNLLSGLERKTNVWVENHTTFQEKLHRLMIESQS